MLKAAEGVDILVTNAGGPPPGLWSDWDREDFHQGAGCQHAGADCADEGAAAGHDGARLGPGGQYHLAVCEITDRDSGLSNSARAGLTGYVAGTARQVAGAGVTINNLQPGIHATDRAISLDTGVSQAQGISMDEAKANRCATIPAGRYGTRQEFGATCAFLCSQHAGFIVGQNILLDGGAVNSTM